MKTSLALIWGVFLSISLYAQQFPKLPWKKEKVHPGITLLTLQTDRLFDSQQYINVLKVGKKRSIDLDYEAQELKATSEFARENGALAAINAGFFNMKEGGSVTFMKINDKVVNQHRTESALLIYHALAINEQGRLEILPHAQTAYLAAEETLDDALFTGPLLLEDGKLIPPDSVKFNLTRHPRTCACTLKNGKALLVTVDGRSEQARGMSMWELAQLMKSFKCHQAINLDGGGSTTMWIQGRGIVNHPSDNRIFDAEGERKVANVILVY